MSDTDTDTETAPADPKAKTGEATGVGATSGPKGETSFIEYSKARQTMSRRIAESKATIPHLYLQARVDLSRLNEVRAGFLPQEDAVPTLNDLVIKATALALGNHPRANGTYRDGGIELHSRINIGMAVDTGDGSITPVITDADRRPLGEIATAARDLAARARSGEITPPEQAGATFAISNLGALGITASEPVVNPGQSAKLAVGAATDLPVVRDGELAVGSVMELNLSCDHRVLHGGEAARLLNEIKANLENPDLLT